MTQDKKLPPHPQAELSDEATRKADIAAAMATVTPETLPPATKRRVQAYKLATSLDDDLLGGCLSNATFWEMVTRIERVLEDAARG